MLVPPWSLIVLRLGHDLEESPGDVRPESASLRPAPATRPASARGSAGSSVRLRTSPAWTWGVRRTRWSAPRGSGCPGLIPRLSRATSEAGSGCPARKVVTSPRITDVATRVGRSSGLCGRGCGGEAARHHRPLFKSEHFRPERLSTSPRQRPRSPRVRGHEFLTRGNDIRCGSWAAL